MGRVVTVAAVALLSTLVVVGSSTIAVRADSNYVGVPARGYGAYGGVQAAGTNPHGQLGEGDTTGRTSPNAVCVTATTPPTCTTSLTGITQVTSGGIHSVALKKDGTVWVWGLGGQGELGQGSGDLTDHLTAVQVPSLTSVVAVAAGGDYSGPTGFSVALKSDGTVWTWGANSYGQLGNGNNTQQNSPVQVSSITNIVAIAAAHFFAAALKSDGTVWAWGAGGIGQLGRGNWSNSNVPVQFGTVSNVTSIAAESANLIARKADGTLWISGFNGQGQLGNNTCCSNVNSPVQVTNSSLANAKAIAGGYAFALAINSDGTVYAWGTGANGQIGNNGTADSYVPVAVNTITNVVGIACGSSSAQAIEADGSVWGWGLNTSGQLGLGNSTSPQKVPVQNTNSALTGTVSVGSGADSAYTLWIVDSTTTNEQGWGKADFGQLGNNSTSSPQYGPVQVSSFSGVTNIAGGEAFSIARKSDGSVWAWGDDSKGQLGNNSTTQSNVPVNPTMTYATSVAAGQAFSVALKADGSVWTWGGDAYGQLGQNNTTELHVPTQITGVTGFSGISTIVAGQSFAMALKSDGTVWTWGANGNGQLGQGNTTELHTPTQIASGTLSNIKAIAAGVDFAYALKSDGTVWTWGDNTNGELGQGDTTQRSTPTQIASGTLSGVSMLTAGINWGAALKYDGTVWTWGGNGTGQLGQGNTTELHTPTQISSFSSVESLASGQYFAISIKSDGTVWEWGGNTYGQQGTGTTTNQLLPQQAASFLTFSGLSTVGAGWYHALAIGPAPTCSGGSLTLTAPGNFSFPAKTLTGVDLTTTSNQVFTANDMSGAAVGWDITGTSTTFTAGSNTLPTTATTVTAGSAVADSGNCSTPTNSIGYPVTLPAAASAPAAVKIYNAAAGSGGGPSDATLTFQLAIPANAFNGTYTSTWTFTLASGP